MKPGEPVRQETEIWVRQDGTVYARNLTSGLAAVLTTLNEADAGMRQRAAAGEELEKWLDEERVDLGNEEGER